MNLSEFVAMYAGCVTLPDLMMRRAKAHPEMLAYRFLVEGDVTGPQRVLDYRTLDRRARAIAAELLARGFAGECALMLYPASLDFLECFLGCLYAGVVAVPAYPPEPKRLGRTLPRLQAIAADSRAKVVVGTADVLRMASAIGKHAPDLAVLQWIATDTIADGCAENYCRPDIEESALAFLQYTSGSTGTPKGVELTHANLMHNLRMGQVGSEHDKAILAGRKGDLFASWLPLFHDLGLIYTALGTVYSGMTSTLFSPLAFIQRPARWLEAVSAWGAHTSGAPNFAFDLCVRKVTEQELANVDLSRWEFAYSAAEPIRYETMERFFARMAPRGLRRGALGSGYGLAESAVFVTKTAYGQPAAVLHVDGDRLNNEGQAVLVEPSAPEARPMVGCGRSWLDQVMKIVDPVRQTELPDLVVGELWLSSGSVGRGYWERPDATAETFGGFIADTGAGPFLRTGDLAFLHQGELYITGRHKDLIIIRGLNHYPQDIESTAEKSHPRIRPGSAAAFSIEVADQEALVIVAEVDEKQANLDVDDVVAVLRAAVSAEHQVSVYAVELIKAQSSSKTSSGKIQRRLTKASFLDGSLESVARRVFEAELAVEPPAPTETTTVLPATALPSEDQRRIEAFLRAAVAERTSLPQQEVDTQRPLFSYGLSSLALVEISGALAQVAGRMLPPTLLFDYPTIDAVAMYLAGAAPRRQMRAESSDEPIAVIGIGCRFPGGVDGPARFWELLTGGVDAVTEVPPERWDVNAWYDADPAAKGKMRSRWGAFLREVDTFDADFFQVTPREASFLDPQQRLLLEVTWEALEHAGIRPERLKGSLTGVFVGLCGTEYPELQRRAPAEYLEGYGLTGGMVSIAAGRLSYTLGFQGPCVAVDTACSSSLVAVHQAVQNLRLGECDLAVAGGVNLVLSPEVSVQLSRLAALSPTGRCRAFAADADGYVRGEGCGIVVLKRLSDAQADGDEILAVIRGSAINQDGRSQGLTAPNGPAQQAVIRRAIELSGLAPAAVGYVETHGTGTPLGDPIEVGALAAVLGEGRPAEHPLLIGSVKTNIGHTEGAAGIAGFIKAVLSVHHRRLPPSLHFAEPNPHIGWSALPVRVVDRLTEWPGNATPRVAGVSAFGFSGTNAHVIVAQAPASSDATQSSAEPRPVHIVPLSGGSPEALVAQAARLCAHLEAHPDVSLADTAFTVAVARTAFPHRHAVTARTRESLLESLAALRPHNRSQQVAPSSRLAYLFTGQGAQHIGMGRQLYESEPVFRQAFDCLAAGLDGLLERPLIDVVFAAPGSSDAALINTTAFTQPALFVLELALLELWRSWGVEPDVVAGHSIGEIAAACAAGVFSAEDGLRLVAARGRLMQSLPPGEMVSIRARAVDVAPALVGYEASVSIAAVNAPDRTVISGPADDIKKVLEKLGGFDVRRLVVSHAFHSPMMTPILEAFGQVAASIRYTAPRLPLISGLSGQVAGAEVTTAEYWMEQLRSPVQFLASVQSAHAMGAGTFIELGPRPSLLGLAAECLHGEGRFLPSLRPGKDDIETILGSLGRLWETGRSVDWSAFHADRGGRRVKLPAYAFQRRRHWFEQPQATKKKAATNAFGASEGRGRFRLSGNALALPGTEVHHVLEIAPDEPSYMADHVVYQHVVVAGAFFVATALSVAADHWDASQVTLENVRFLRPLVLTAPTRLHIRLSLISGEDATEIEISTGNDTDGWRVHFEAIARSEASPPSLQGSPQEAATATDLMSPEQFDARLAALHLDRGPRWGGLRWVKSGDRGTYLEVRGPAGAALEAPLHPVLLDTCLVASLASVMVEDSAGSKTPRLPYNIESLRWYGRSAETVRGLGMPRATPDSDEAAVRDVVLWGEDGAVVAELHGLTVKRAPHDTFMRVAGVRSELPLLIGVQRPASPPPPLATLAGRWAVIATDVAEGAAFSERIAAAGAVPALALLGPTGGDNGTPLDPSVPDAVYAWLHEVVAGQLLEGVVCLWGHGLDAATPAAAAHRTAQAGLAVAQAIQRLTEETASNPKVVWARRSDACLATEPLWGLGRVWLREQPDTRCVLVDLAGGACAETDLGPILTSTDDEPEVVLRDGQYLVRRLARLPAPPKPFVLRTDGTVVITGGLGALGLEVAGWLAKRGVSHLVLIGRSAPRDEQLAVIEALRTTGAIVTTARADVADCEQLRAVFDAIPSDRPLRGVVHAAGLLDDGQLATMTPERLANVMAPKVDGAWNLHELTRSADLDLFVLFSSASSLLGWGGQSNYAAANAFLDALARQRRDQGLVAHSLNLGPIANIGMAARLSQIGLVRLARLGLELIRPNDGLDFIQAALTLPEPQIAILPIRVDVMAQEPTLPPILADLVAERRRRSQPLAKAAVSVRASRFAHLPEAARRPELEAILRAEASRILGLGGAADVPTNRPLQELGLDSIMAVELRNAINAIMGVTLPATLLFDHPTIDALVQHILSRVQRSGRSSVASTSAPEVTTTADEPLAIIGMSCRLPGGVTDLESFWRLLEAGGDGVTEIPRERWDVDAVYDPRPEAIGKMYTRHAGFVSDVDQFDPAFFGIAPREADAMDPQQRLLLETAWEALEHAGEHSANVMGSRTGVFLGVMSYEYASLFGGQLESLDGHVLTGNTGSVASGRISYLLGLKGPSLTVDTACSSSLVALHLACQSLRTRECNMALVGGASLIFTPALHVEFSRLRGLAPDGRCKSFDARANGVGWSEGCGMIALKRLSDARADGNPILAIVRGSATNQDGRSQGLTAPNGPSQQDVIRRALAQARVEPSMVDYVEAHGTGTSLGDPIEVHALGAVFAEDRPAHRPLLIGSAKSNIGHTLAAAGVAGLIKTVLAFQRERLPRTVHFETPSPHIAWADLPVKVVDRTLEWRPNGKRRIAGVSSFGISGTNAHVVLEEAPTSTFPENPVEHPSAAHVVLLSAHTPDGLAAQADRLAQWIDQRPEATLPDIAYTTSCRRTHHPERIAFVVADTAELVRALRDVARGVDSPAAYRGRADTTGKVAFVFSGQGGQWIGMGRALLEQSPTFANTLAEVDEAIKSIAGWSVIDVLRGSGPAVDAIDILQPTLFGVAVALAAVWRNLGVEPDALIGHSQGEVAAACLAGALTLPDAARVIVERSRLLRRLSGQGAMALVELPMEQVAQRLAGVAGLSISAVNGPGSTVVSGDTAALDAWLSQFDADQVFYRRVKVDVAAHSPVLDPLLPEIAAALANIRPRRGAIPLWSTVTGELLDGSTLDAAYWVANLRQTVQFAQAVRAAANDGCRFFVELSPHPLLTLATSNMVPSGVVVPTLHRDDGSQAEVLRSLAQLYTRGFSVDWARLHPTRRRVLPLPPYAFQRRRCWLTEPTAPSAGWGARTMHGQPGHPLLGTAFTVSLQRETRFWEKTLSLSALPYLADHRVEESAVLPAAAYVEMAAAAGAAALGTERLVIEDIAFREALVFDPNRPATVQVSLAGDSAGGFRFQVARRDGDTNHATWTVLATARVRAATSSDLPAEPADPAAPSGDPLSPFAIDDLYARMAKAGLNYGPAFTSLASLEAGSGEARSHVQVPDVAGSTRDYLLHPVLLDGCFHSTAAIHLPDADTSGPSVPVTIRRVVILGRAEGRVACHTRVSVRDGGKPGIAAQFELRDLSGACIARVDGMEAQPLARAAAPDPLRDLLYHVEWPQVALPQERGPAGRWLVLADRRGLGDRLALALRAAGAVVVLERDPHILANRASAAALLDRVLEGDADLTGILHAFGLDGEPLDDHAKLPANPALLGLQGWATALHLAQALEARSFRDAPRLVLLTERSQPPALTHPPRPDQALLWGLGATLFAEHPEWRTLRVDLSDPSSDAETAALAGELLAATDEDQVAIRADVRHVARLRSGAPPVQDVLQRAGDRPYRLVMDEPGVLDRLALREMKRKRPGPGEVEIEVHATGLNFIDVLKAMGTYPGMEAGAQLIGGECAGRVVAVGEGVTHLSEGDEVMGLAPGSFATHVVAPAHAMVKRPRSLTMEQAAAVPIVFGTAWYALYTLGRLSRGDRVLIHSATGGTGQAAIQLARRVGADILATAGTPDKRALLQQMGIAHVMDSRSGDFADAVMVATAGEGVDVVLNSLSGPLIEKGLACLAVDGRFLEIGKRDIYEDRPLGLQCFRKRISFHAVDLAGMAVRRPKWFGDMLQEIARAFDAGELAPPQITAHPISDVKDVFRTMARAQHVGKLVVRLQDPDVPIAVDRFSSAAALRSDGSYLVTGGLGGLGLAAARWMAQRGAGHLVLLGRRGVTTDEQRSALDALRSAGARVTVVQADMADAVSLEHAVRSACTSEQPLRGVVHAAGILDDALIAKQSVDRFRAVMVPKVFGACNLHALTLGQPLDFFVIYSSAAAIFGSPGQANYAAANAFLDAFARWRHASGIPATSVNFGAFGDVGLAAAQDNRAARLAQQGMDSLHVPHADATLDRVLTERPVQLTVASLDVRRWLEFNPQAAGWPFLADLLNAPRRGADRARGDADLLASLRAAPPAERVDRLAAIVAGHVAQVLRLGSASVPASSPLVSLGMDSLMGLELRNRLESALGLSLPATLIWTYPTVDQIARSLCTRLFDNDAPRTLADEPAQPSPVQSAPMDAAQLAQERAMLDGLSQDELMAELSKLL